MREFSFLGKITIVSIWFRMVSTQRITWVKYFFHLDIPTKYQYLIGITNHDTHLKILNTINSSIDQTNIGVYSPRYLYRVKPHNAFRMCRAVPGKLLDIYSRLRS